MLIQSIGLIQSFKGSSSHKPNKKRYEAKIMELQNKKEELNNELDKIFPSYRYAKMQYIIARDQKNKMEHQIREISDELSKVERDLSLLQADYQYWFENQEE